MIDTRQARRIAAVVEVARAWREPSHPPRQAAVAETLTAPNRFTEEAVAFAINQQMHTLQAPSLEAWVRGHWAEPPARVGVLHAGNLPMVGLQDLLAVLLTGHHYHGVLSSKSPYLLPAFVASLRAADPSIEAAFSPAKAMFAAVQAVIATGTDETMDWVAEACRAEGLPAARCLLRGHRYGVAVLDGQEDEQERENLAEDTLLHDGAGCRNVALIWAPEGLSPDAYLDAFAHFRAVFPAHAALPGTLQMQKAFLEAVGAPHAYDDDLTFLVSKGEPEAQGPGHVRWASYADVETAYEWIRSHHDQIQLVVRRPGLDAPIGGGIAEEPLGQAQRPAVGWCPDGRDTVDFLSGLS